MKTALNELHKEYSFENGNPDAVLFIHGILGSPSRFRLLAEHLSKQGFDCHALLLPGHGSTARAFYSTPYHRWPAYVKGRVNEACAKYRRVFLVGYSLGGLISLDCAACGGVAGIVLINTPLAFKVSLRQLAFSMKILLCPKERDDALLAAYREDFSVSGAALFEYPLWLRQFMGLFRYVRQIRRLLKDVKPRALIIQSARDESVQRCSAGMLKDGLPNAWPEVLSLEESYHGYFPEEDQQRLLCAVEQFVTDG